jgi:hypothetical protein
MIDDKKLLCAFILSAYESGYCGHLLGEKTKEEHKRLYREYIGKESYFPEEEIRTTQGQMMSSVSNSSIRDYIYIGHFDVVKNRIKEETGLELKDAINSKDKLLKSAAMLCPVSLYQVIKVIDKSEVEGEDLVLKRRRKLTILEGLENPRTGDIVSGHWGFILEILDDDEEIIKYETRARDYYYNFK